MENNKSKSLFILFVCLNSFVSFLFWIFMGLRGRDGDFSAFIIGIPAFITGIGAMLNYPFKIRFFSYTLLLFIFSLNIYYGKLEEMAGILYWYYAFVFIVAIIVGEIISFIKKLTADR